MGKQRTIASISTILDRGVGSVPETAFFENRKHESLVTEFRNYLENHKFLLAASHLEITQALNDRGTDLILQFADCKIGFQIKSHYDVKQQDFAANVKRQLAESFAHGLDKWYLLICSPLYSDNKDYSGKIRHLLNELSTYKIDYYVEAYGPESAIKYFNAPNDVLSKEEFDNKLSQYFGQVDKSSLRIILKYYPKWGLGISFLVKVVNCDQHPITLTNVLLNLESGGQISYLDLTARYIQLSSFLPHTLQQTEFCEFLFPFYFMYELKGDEIATPLDIVSVEVIDSLEQQHKYPSTVIETQKSFTQLREQIQKDWEKEGWLHRERE